MNSTEASIMRVIVTQLLRREEVERTTLDRKRRYGLLLLALLPVVLVAGSCPDLAGTTYAGTDAAQWICRLFV